MNVRPRPDEIEAIERLLSLERLSRYASISGGDRHRALYLYEKNTEISESLYTPLQGLEVALRNACSIELTAVLGEDWHENRHNIFQHPITEMIDTAKRSLTTNGKDITLGRMVAELNLGFWVGILSPRYENTLWRPCLRKSFPARPRGIERKDVHKSLNALRRLRNRVAHHEPILHRDLVHDHALILGLVSWTCPVTADWIKQRSRFEAVFAAP